MLYSCFLILMKNNKTKDELAEEQKDFPDMNTNFQTISV